MAEGTIGGKPISQLPRSSYAYCEPNDGPCHFPIRDANGKPDEAHVRNALSRLSQSPFEADARPKVEAAAKELGIGAPASRAMMDMPTDAASMRAHLVAAEPAGHGLQNDDLADTPMSNMAQQHASAHGSGAGHSHSAASLGRSESILRDGSFLVRTLPPNIVYEDGESVRAVSLGSDGEDSPGYLTGRFAVFDTWTEVRSQIEGHFMERTGEGAFRKAISEGRPPIIFQHGRDPQLGTRPIAPTEDIGTDARGGYYGGPLLKGVPELVVSGLRAGLYGSSYRFRAIRPEVNVRPKPSAYNPNAIPEVTVREATLKEVGPGMFPVYKDTSAIVRSETDDYLLSRFGDPEQIRTLLAAQRGDLALPTDGAGDSHSEDESRSDPPPPVVIPTAVPAVPSRFHSRGEWLDYLKEKSHR